MGRHLPEAFVAEELEKLMTADHTCLTSIMILMCPCLDIFELLNSSLRETWCFLSS